MKNEKNYSKFLPKFVFDCLVYIEEAIIGKIDNLITKPLLIRHNSIYIAGFTI